jgi:hypothetical protein
MRDGGERKNRPKKNGEIKSLEQQTRMMFSIELNCYFLKFQLISMLGYEIYVFQRFDVG